MTRFQGNFIQEEITIDASKANMKALYLMLPLACMAVIPYLAIWLDEFSLSAFRAFAKSHTGGIGSTLKGLGVIVAGIVLHEIIHGITWSLFAKQGIKSISFGVLWKELTPYCHCKEPLRIRQYIIGAIMPAIILGFIPVLVAYVTGNFIVLAFGVFFTVAAAGDFMMIGMLRNENPDDFVQDHPSKIGCFIYRKHPDFSLVDEAERNS